MWGMATARPQVNSPLPDNFVLTARWEPGSRTPALPFVAPAPVAPLAGQTVLRPCGPRERGRGCQSPLLLPPHSAESRRGVPAPATRIAWAEGSGDSDE